MTVPYHKTEGAYRVDVTDDGRTWATNALRFDTVDDATIYANDLANRWLAVKVARVVTSDTPDRERVDPDDDRIVFGWV